MKCYKLKEKCYSVGILFLSLIIFNASYAVDSNSIAIDYANFMAKDSATTSLEVYCQFSNSDLYFIKVDSGFVANIEIVAVLYDQDGIFIKDVSTEQSIYVTYYDLTKDERKKSLVQFNFFVKPGKYQILLQLSDKNINKTIKLEKDIIVSAFDIDRLSISDIQVATLIERTNQTSNFVKNGRKILSNPSRTFDYSSLNAEFYFEIYNLSYKAENRKNSFSLNYLVKNEDNQIITRFSRSFVKPCNDSAINFSIPINNLAAGNYQLEVNIIDEDTHAAIAGKTNFYIVRSPIDLRFADYDKILKMLKIIANRDEIKNLKKVAQRERQLALYEFWKSKDPTPATAENEFMIEFYSRIAYANKKFATPGIEGWKTDRGKIFIRYGKPDRIYRSMSSYGWEQYEMWEYYNQSQTYIFEDRHGFGNYRLVSNRFF